MRDGTKLAILTVVWVIAACAMAIVASGTAFDRGVASVPRIDCTPAVAEAQQVAGQIGYDQGVAHTMQAIQSYVVGACMNMGEFTAGGMTFVCLPKQEM